MKRREVDQVIDMRVAYLAAGAGGMYCGSCLRDNRMAATLRARGKDVVLLPLYTPLRTDERNVSDGRIYYGGINVYLQQAWPRLRFLPGFLARMLDSPRLLRRAMRFAGEPGPHTLGRLTVSILRGEEGPQRRELARLIEGLRAIEPDVVVLPNLMFVGLSAPIKEALGATLLCTLSGEDFFLDALPQTHREEAFDLVRRHAAGIDGFVAATRYYADHAAGHFHLPHERVHVVPMGVTVEHFKTPARPPAEPFTVGYLARICPEKGLARLCEAVVKLVGEGRSCRLRIAGYLGRGDRGYLEQVRDHARNRGCEAAIDHVGELDLLQKAAFLRSLHVLSVPTVHPEAKGLYVLEALAGGVPVVQPRHGSFPELIDATGGGLLYDPHGVEPLAEALAKLMDDDALRERLGQAGQRAVRESFTDRNMADRFWSLCERVVANR